MTVDWANYQPYVPPFDGPLSALSRKEAKISFEHFMSERPARLEQLTDLLAKNGVVLSFDSDNLDITNDWFVANVESRESTINRLENIWYSIILDLTVFIGEAIISRHPELHWDLFIWGKKNASYHTPVIMGFENITKVPMDMNLSLALVVYANRVTQKLPVPRHYFVSLVDQATKLLQIVEEN